MTQKIFIHPGFSKSGTTSLQYFFNSLDAVLSITQFSKIPEHKEFFKIINGSSFPLSHEAAKNIFEKINTDQDKNVIISNEGLNAGIHRLNEKILDNLKNLFPDAKVIFTIRDQVSAIKSHYANHGRLIRGLPKPYSGIKVKFNDYFEFNIYEYRRSYFQIINYNNMISLWEKFFKKEDILILPLELILKNKQQYFKKIFEFMNLDFDVSKVNSLQLNNATTYNMERFEHFKRIMKSYNLKFLNQFSFVKKLNNYLINIFSSQKKISPTLNDIQLSKLKELYLKDNAKLNKRYNLNLEKFGYFLK